MSNKKILLINLFYTILLTGFCFGQTQQWRVFWDKNPEADIDFYQIYRATQPMATFPYATLDHPASGPTVLYYTDTNIEKGTLYYYRIKAANNSGIMSDFSVEVTAAIPSVAIPNQTIGSTDSFQPINLNNYVSDLDHSDNQISWSFSGNQNLTIQITNQVATITPTNSWIGSETILFTATDPDSFFDVASVVFTIQSQSTPNISNIADQTILLGEAFDNIDLDDFVDDPDHNDNQLVWSVSGAEDITINITDRVAAISVNNASWVGSDTVTFTVTDPDFNSDNEIVYFTVLDTVGNGGGEIPVEEQKVVTDPTLFRPGSVDHIAFTKLPENGQLLIFDISGNPLFKTNLPTDTYNWSVKNQVGKDIRSGVYLYVVNDSKGNKYDSGKVIIVR